MIDRALIREKAELTLLRDILLRSPSPRSRRLGMKLEDELRRGLLPADRELLEPDTTTQKIKIVWK